MSIKSFVSTCWKQLTYYSFLVVNELFDGIFFSFLFGINKPKQYTQKVLIHSVYIIVNDLLFSSHFFFFFSAGCVLWKYKVSMCKQPITYRDVFNVDLLSHFVRSRFDICWLEAHENTCDIVGESIVRFLVDVVILLRLLPHCTYCIYHSINNSWSLLIRNQLIILYYALNVL